MKKLVKALIVICLTIGCSSNPPIGVTIPQGSSKVLDIRKSQPTDLERKYSYRSPDNEESEVVEIQSKRPTLDNPAQPAATSSIIPLERERRMALVIGNSNYVNGGSLANPVNDAKAMASTLKDLGFDVLMRTNVGQTDMKKTIDQFGDKLKSYDVGLFFYAGHGLQVKGTNYLIPSDANIKTENDVEYNAIDAGRILAKMEDAGSKANILMLDACRDNPFERSWTRSAKGKGLAFMNAPSGSIIAYATSPGNTALDGKGKNGVYTSAILKFIKTPNTSIEEMFKRVRVEVEDETKKSQIPWESTSLKGSFFFNPVP